MAKITVEFCGAWRTYLGANQLALIADDTNDALLKIAEWGFRERLLNYGIHITDDLKEFSFITLNGVMIGKARLLKLNDGDIIRIYSLLEGG